MFDASMRCLPLPLVEFQSLQLHGSGIASWDDGIQLRLNQPTPIQFDAEGIHSL